MTWASAARVLRQAQDERLLLMTNSKTPLGLSLSKAAREIGATR